MSEQLVAVVLTRTGPDGGPRFWTASSQPRAWTPDWGWWKPTTIEEQWPRPGWPRCDLILDQRAKGHRHTKWLKGLRLKVELREVGGTTIYRRRYYQ